MKKRGLALLLAGCLALSGCTSMLEREFVSVEPHREDLTAAGDPSTLLAQNYQELLSAILYLVTQHAETGTIRLSNYPGDVSADLTAACLEVVQKDPLGAYAVDYIKHDVSRIVSYYEATLTLAYRHTAEEVGKIVSVTGSGAIKDELRETLSHFATGATLRISYFAEDESYIHDLVALAYYSVPQAAFGLPEVTMSLYPESGIQRIVELELAYPLGEEELLQKQDTLMARVEELLPKGTPATAREVYDLLVAQVSPTQEAGFSTPYAALTEGKADAEGFALTYKLLCDQAGLSCTVVQGSETSSHPFWNIVTTDQGSRHVDCSQADRFGLTDLQLTELGGYAWDSSYPLCRDGREMQISS